jgi:hypothetical protein
MKTVTIEGYHINLDHESFNVRTVKDLKKAVELFSHLEGEEKDKAYDLLWNELHPNAKTPKEITDVEID